MLLNINMHLAYELSEATDLLLQVEVADVADQRVLMSGTDFSDISHMARVPAEEGLGDRIWIRADGEFRCTYRSQIHVDRPALDLTALSSVVPHLLPWHTVRYLMPSRYCQSDQFSSFTEAQFGHLDGGAKIDAMCAWIHSAFSYVPGSSNAQTTAVDSFVQRRGICRDFAHVLITLARASDIPARFVSAYAPDVTPQDFHAVAEVYLDGTWHLVDATGMAPADTIARIGVGSDAADVAFLGVFGQTRFIEQSVVVTRA